MKYALSNTDIMNYLNHQTKIIKYSDVHTYNNIQNLLQPYGNCFILYETSPNHGHWVVITYSNKVITFFDPYGGRPDSQFAFIPPEFAAASYQNYPYLTRLLQESGMKVVYNPYQFQKLEPGIRSCGRWCILWTKCKDMTLKDFAKIFLGKDFDDVVAFLTS